MVIGGGVTLFLGLAGGWVLNLRSSWAGYIQYAPFMWQTALVATLSVWLNCHAIHEAACKRFSFLMFLVRLVACELAILAGVTGDRLLGPDGLLAAVVHGSPVPELGALVLLMLSTRVAAVVCVVAQMLGGRYLCSSPGSEELAT